MHERKIYSNTLFQIFTKIATSGSGFLATILMAKYFGNVFYGNFIKITAYVGLFYVISDFGINAIFLQREDPKSDFRSLLYLRILIAGIIVLFINLFALLLPYNPATKTGFAPELRLGIALFSFTIIIQSILTSSAAIFQKRLRYDLQTISIVVGSLLTLILIALTPSLTIRNLGEGRLEYILLSYVVGGSLSVFIALKLQGEKVFPITLEKESALQLLKNSIPLGIMLFFNLVYFRVDTVILSFFKSSADVGIYGYAYKFFDFLIAIPLFLSNSVYPLLLKNQKNLRSYYQFSQKYITIFFCFSLLVLIPAWFLAPLIAVKADFIPSILTFRILISSLPLFFLTSILQWILITQKQKLYLLKVYLFSALINTILNLLFIPHFSYQASAIITGVSELLVLMLLLHKFIRMKRKSEAKT